MPLSPSSKSWLKKIFLGIYVLVLTLIGTQLFFEDQLSFFANSLQFFRQEETHGSDDRPLTIGYALGPSTLEPTFFDHVTRNYLVDIYQGLVRTDRNLKIEPAIAVSWGLIDPKIWEFRLRPGVLFHNGNPVTPDDIVSSIQRAKFFEESQLKNLLSSVEKVEVVGNDRIRIYTHEPDPLLLNKLAVTYIFPQDLKDYSTPVGTGPYKFISATINEMRLVAFDDYWGDQPFYQNVVLQTIPDRDERIAALEEGNIQLLTSLPPSIACSMEPKYVDAEGCSRLENSNITIKAIPSLEVSFLIFNFENEIFNKRTIRSAISKTFDPQFFVDVAFGFAKPVGQFVSSGVFGFNSTIQGTQYNLEDAVKEAEALFAGSFERIEVTFDYPEALHTLGEYVQTQLLNLGINVILNPLSDTELREKIRKGESDFYFLGWRSELGDANDFLEAVAHSREPNRGFGQFNGANYVNKKIDQLVEKSAKSLLVEQRLKDLQEAMKILVKDDVLGVPLYESEIIYAFDRSVRFEPRVDGYVYPSEIY